MCGHGDVFLFLLSRHEASWGVFHKRLFFAWFGVYCDHGRVLPPACRLCLLLISCYCVAVLQYAVGGLSLVRVWLLRNRALTPAS